MDVMLTGLTGAAAFIDDIIVTGATQDKLLKCLNNMVFMCEWKTQFFLMLIQFLRFISDKNG